MPRARRLWRHLCANRYEYLCIWIFLCCVVGAYGSVQQSDEAAARWAGRVEASR